MEAIERDLATVSAHIDAAEHRRLSLIRELIELDVSLGDHLSVAQWLSWRIGLSPGAARERVRVAMALGTLPRIDEALKNGELSYSKIRAMTRVATPDNEQALLQQARMATASQLEKICRRVSAVKRSEGERSYDDGDRWVQTRPTDDGMVVITAKLLPDEAAAVMKAIASVQRNALEKQQAEERRARGTSLAVAEPAESSPDGRAAPVSAETPPQRPPRRPGQADALVAMADLILAGGLDGPHPVADRNQVIVALTPSTLIEGSYQVALDDGTRVSAETLRRIACDAGLVPAVASDNGEPLNVGRKTRTIPASLRRALELRDGGCCRFPGCTNRYWLEGHHAQSWLEGGETRLGNLILLCKKHHRLLHEGGYRVDTRSDGAFLFLDPHDCVIDAAPARPPLPSHPVAALMARHASEGIHIDEQSCQCTWQGEQPDYDMCAAAIVASESGGSSRRARAAL